MFRIPAFSYSRLARALSLALAMTAAATAHAGSGVWTTNGPYGGFVSAVAINETAANTLWASGQGGVFRSYNSGGTWTRVEVGLPDALGAGDLVAASSGNVLYLNTSDHLYRSGNAGDLWVPTSLPAGLAGTGVIMDLSLRHGTTNSIALATEHGAFVSLDGGSTWTGPGTGLAASARYTSIDFAADGTLYLNVEIDGSNVYGGVAVLKSTNNGASWSPTTASPTVALAEKVVSAPSSAQRVYATDGGNVITSSNGGSTWTTVATAGAGCLSVISLAVHPTVPTGLFMSCRNSGIVYTPDATLASPSFTTYGVAAHLTANGADAAQVGSFAIDPNYATSHILYAGTQFGGLFQSHTAVPDFAEINNGFQSTDIRALATHPYDANVILSGAADSFTTAKTVYRSLDSGATWPPSISGINAEQIRAIRIDPTTVDNNPATTEAFTVYAVGRSERLPASANKDGGIYKSTDGGQTWTTIDNGIALVSGRPDMSTVRSIFLDPRSCASPPVGTAPCGIGSGGLNTAIVAGGGRPDFSAGGMPYLSARIYKSTNAGANWTASESGLPLPQDLGTSDPDFAPNLAYGGVVPIVADPTNAQTLYIGTFMSYDPTAPGGAEPTLPNGVFKSIDGGAHWVQSSAGLPRIGGPASSQWDVLSLAINPVAPSTLYASVANLYANPVVGGVYKTINGGASWTNVSTGIAGQDVRALYIDPNDATGNTIYAGSGGTGSNPGGVYKSTDGGLNWNSISIGMPADAATALAMPPRALGAPARILAGTTAGVWDYTEIPDDDADGVSNAMELGIGDGNGDGQSDAGQHNVASLTAPASNTTLARSAHAPHPDSGSITATVDIVSGCNQLNNTTSQTADLYPPDPVGTDVSHDPYGLVSFSMPNCSNAVVTVKFVGANFGPGWTWRNYGPKNPGDDGSFGWYTFSGAKLLNATTWQLTLSSTRQGNYRTDPGNILFVGGPGNLPDLIFDNGLQ